MKYLSYILAALGLFCLSLPLLLIFALLDDDAATSLNQALSQQDLESMQNIVLENGPGLLGENNELRIELDEAESNALISYLSSRGQAYQQEWLLGQGAQLDLQSGRIILKGTLALKPTIFGRYLNYTAQFSVQDDSFTLDQLQLAEYKVPAFVYTYLLDLARQSLAADSNYQLVSTLVASVHDIELSDDKISFALDWQSEHLEQIREQARQSLIDPTTANLLLTYQRQLLNALDTFPETRTSASLTELLVPLFNYALNSPGDSREENRTIFLVLSCYLLDELSLEDLLGPMEPGLQADRTLMVTLESRDDLPRHLVASAAIAAYADDAMANILAVYKEVQDSRTESGFSFSDMSANRVGTRLGILSTSSREEAENLQRFFSTASEEQSYMPLVGRPDGISEERFIELYGSRTSEAYLQRLNEIDAEIEKLSVFQSNGLP